MIFNQPLSYFPDLFSLNQQEKTRIFTSLNLIASENIPSRAVFEATKSIFTAKYSEGYPKARYYGGCEVVDEVEEKAKTELLNLFPTDHANVQPHSGAQANQAVFEAVLNPGDTILALSLDHGGHLTHGHKVNFSGKRYNTVFYGVSRESCLIDMDLVQELAQKHRPRLIIVGASSYSRHFDFKAFHQIAKEVGAFLMADIAHYSGLIAAGVYPSPVRYCDFITSTTHKTLRGPRSGVILCKSEFKSAIDKAVFPFLQGGPHMHTIFAKLVCFRIAKTEEFKSYAQQVVKNAQELAKSLMQLGFTLITGGTDSHMFLVDLSNFDLTGKEAQARLEQAKIYVNKNAIPFDKHPPAVAGGIRIGTPLITSLGLTEKHMKDVAELVFQALIKPDSSLRNKVEDFVRSTFLIPDWLREL